MMGFLCPTLELMIFLPGMLLVYLPMKHYLRMHPAKLAAVTVLLTLFLCLMGGAVSCFFQISTLWLCIGLQAVRHIAEKNGGYCRFLYGDGVFCVNVILRGGK